MTIRTLANPSTCIPASRQSAGFLARIKQATSLRRSRVALSGLTCAQLADIGVTAEQAEKEAARPFWDAPAHWRA